MVIVVGISGASGAIYGLRLLTRLREQQAEIHLILTRSGEKTLFLETGKSAAEDPALSLTLSTTRSTVIDSNEESAQLGDCSF